MQFRTRFKHVGCTELPPRRDDASHRLNDIVLMLVKERTNGGVTLCHQRAAIQQVSHVCQRCVVDGHGLPAHLAQPRNRLFERLRRLRITEKFQLRGHAKAEACAPRPGVPTQAPGVRIVRIRPLRAHEDLPGSLYAAGKDRHHIHALRGRHDTGCADQPPAGFKAHDVVQACGYATRAGRIGT